MLNIRCVIVVLKYHLVEISKATHARKSNISHDLSGYICSDARSVCINAKFRVRKHCDVCTCAVSVGNWSKHQKTKKQLDNEFDLNGI